MVAMAKGGAPQARPLVLALDGARVELAEVDPSLTLLTYLRTTAALRGTKRGCGEDTTQARTKKVEEITVNSCSTLLCSLDGCAVTTTEGLGNQQAGHHAIHKRMSGFHSSQCGFCTPGMTMALYGTLRKSVAKSCNETEAANGSANGAAHGAGDLHLTALVDAELTIAGNLCRCTGYRPLLDTCKSFCGELDVEDLGLRQFPDKNALPPYDATRDPVFPPFLIGECEAGESYSHHNGSVPALTNGVEEVEARPRFRFSDNANAKDREKVWVDLESVADVLKAVRMYQGAGEVKLMVGNTASEYCKDIKPNVYIDVSKSETGCLYNIDPVTKSVSLEDFIWKGASVENGKLLQSIWIPLDKAPAQGGSRVHFKTFRAAPRPLGFALAYVNAAFFARVLESGHEETRLRRYSL